MSRASDIFRPGSLPISTYITRKTSTGFSYEWRLEQALNTTGYLTLISGPSKIGKTVLCEKVIGLDNLVELSGSDFLDKESLWMTIGAKAGMPLSGMVTTGNVESGEISEQYVITRDNVINFFIEHNLVMLMDDFHYASAEMQGFIAQQFKDAIRKGFKVIISSLPHRSDDAIRTNPDLQGRISIIDMESWTKEELAQIPKRGFEQLEIPIAEKYIKALADESIYSPQLMQLLCLSICTLGNYDKGEKVKVTQELLNNAFKFSTLNLDYKKIAKVIREGKAQRGKERKTFNTQKGSQDIYELILDAIAKDPPKEFLEFEELLERVNSFIKSGEKVQVKALKDYLNNLQDVINDNGRAYEVLEWRDNTVYIIEALFLFYLRWGDRSEGRNCR